MSDDSIFTYYRSTDYAKFKFHPVNRALIPKNVERLEKILKTKNFLESFPVVVSKDFYILDGQNRFTAAKNAGLPIFYIISPNMTIADVAGTNSTQLVWSNPDYLKSFVADGAPHYVLLEEFISKYPFLTVTSGQFLMSGDTGNEIHKRFKLGGFKVTRCEFAYQAADVLTDFGKFEPLRKLQRLYPFVRAVATVVANSQYDHKRMMGKLTRLQDKVHQCLNVKGYLSMFTDIYNDQALKNTKVNFNKE